MLAFVQWSILDSESRSVVSNPRQLSTKVSVGYLVQIWERCVAGGCIKSKVK